MPDPIDPTFVLANRIEGVVWLVIGAIVLAYVRRDRAIRRWRGVGVLVLVVFGVSDWVEATTGAWWKPWWLFAWKALCVMYLVGWVTVEIVHQRRVKRMHLGEGT
ncbi:MAG: hypothetical protein QM770_06385 [Tepidisphaeraceae bacterium]